MTTRKSWCQQYERGTSLFNVGLPERYFAAARCDDLPAVYTADDAGAAAGYVVELGEWWFFPDLEPAIAFGRAARMSPECSGYNVYEARVEVRFCDRHHREEAVLLIRVEGGGLRGIANEADIVDRFAQGVREHPDSAYWNPPAALTGGSVAKR